MATLFRHLLPAHALGDNLRFNEIQVAVGRVVLKRLDAGNARRRAIATRYANALRQLPVIVPGEAEWAESVYHLYVIRTSCRDALRAFLRDRGIETRIHYPVACHRQPAVQRFPPVSLPRTEALVGEILSLPIFPDLDDASVDMIVGALRDFFSGPRHEGCDRLRRGDLYPERPPLQEVAGLSERSI